MVELGRLARGLPGRVIARLEMRNPCGGVKDRLGVALIEDASRWDPESSEGSGRCATLAWSRWT